MVLTVTDQEGESNIFDAQVVVNEKEEEFSFEMQLVLIVLGGAILFFLVMLFVPGAMGRISGSSKLDIAAVIKQKVDEKMDQVDIKDLLPEMLTREQAVPEPAAPPMAPMPMPLPGPAAAPAPEPSILASTRFCTDCGSTFEKAALFCTECGKHV